MAFIIEKTPNLTEKEKKALQLKAQRQAQRFIRLVEEAHKRAASSTLTFPQRVT